MKCVICVERLRITMQPVHVMNITVGSLQSLYIYRPPTKLRKGNVFCRVCHSVQGRGSTQNPRPWPWTCPLPQAMLYRDHLLFNLDLTVQNPQIRLVSRRSASYWNAFLFLNINSHFVCCSRQLQHKRFFM